MQTGVISEERLARMLNLSISEYTELKHFPLYPFWDKNSGRVSEYYMYINPSNKAELLSKLKVDESNFVRFSMEEVFSDI
jgi:hypothetical protein